MLELPQTESLGRRLDLPEELEGVVTAQPRSAAQRLRLSIYIATGTVGAIAFILCVLTALEVMPWKARWATDWFLVALLMGIGPVAVFKRRDLKRIEAIDDKFPDFLRDMAESARAGMTLPRALVTASRGQYGALTPEIRKMSAQVQWGVGFTEVLDRFAKRSGSPLIRRIVTLIIEARRAGGNVVDVLTAASDDAREIKQIVQSRNNQMKSYSIVIYVTFAVFVGVVLVIQAQFLPAFKAAVVALKGAPAVKGLRLQDFDPDTYNTAFFHASLMQAITGGLVGGVLTRGKALAGLGGIFFMVCAAWFCFRVLSGV